jgi:hypothetical protein
MEKIPNPSIKRRPNHSLSTHVVQQTLHHPVWIRNELEGQLGKFFQSDESFRCDITRKDTAVTLLQDFERGGSDNINCGLEALSANMSHLRTIGWIILLGGCPFSTKMIMVYLLMNYHFKFPEGVTGRPESFAAETQFLPNHTAKLSLKGGWLDGL